MYFEKSNIRTETLDKCQKVGFLGYFIISKGVMGRRGFLQGFLGNFWVFSEQREGESLGERLLLITRG